MPIIVPIEDNKAGLATATDAKFRAPDYSGSGLEALGAGVVQLGAGLEERRRRAAEAIAAAMLDDRHQSNIDDAAVKQAYVNYSDQTHEALHGDDGLLNEPGAVAHAAFPGVVETLVDHHDKALSKLDDVQRATLAPVLNERLRSDVGRAADYVRQQSTAEQKWQSEQLQKAAARDALNHADDPDLFDHHLATGENAIRQQAKIDNLSDKVLDKQIADYKSAVHASLIDAPTQQDAQRVEATANPQSAAAGLAAENVADHHPDGTVSFFTDRPSGQYAENTSELDTALPSTEFGPKPAVAYTTTTDASPIHPGLRLLTDGGGAGQFDMRDTALDQPLDDGQDSNNGRITFGPDGRPTTHGDGQSLGETIFRKIFGNDTPPPPRRAAISRDNPVNTNLFAQLSEAVYDDDTMFDASEVAVPAHKFGFKTRDFRLADGLVAKIYEVGNTVILAFVGTELSNRSRVGVDFGDLRADAANDVGITDTQFTHAVDIARALKARIGNRQLILTGHSLGGGLASLAAVATRSRAFTFNAAGIRDNILRQYGATRQDAERLVVETYYRQDPLSVAQRDGVFLPGGIPYRLAQPIGIRHPVGPLRGLPNHSMSAILGALNNP